MTRSATRFLFLGLSLAATLAACSHDLPTLPDLIDISPFQSASDGPVATDTNRDTIAVGLPCTLRWTEPGYSVFLWTLTAPPGSLATLSVDTVATPSFTPDVVGRYEVTVTASNGVIEQSALSITAATYLGESACAQCHPTRPDDATHHSENVEEHGTVLFSTPGCLTCHVLNPVPATATVVPGSFDDQGFDPDDFTTFSALPANVAERASVQCESCHGPGSEHASDPRKISIPLRSEQCGACHNGTVGPNRLAQWQGSPHGKAPPAAALADPDCRRCHSAKAFLYHQKGLPPPDAGPGTPGITCALCHDPHKATNPSQMRLFGLTEITSGGAYNGGRAASCLVCHQSNVKDADAYAVGGAAFPCSVQADMLTARGAVEYGMAFGTSFHGTTVFRLRPFTGNPADPDYSDACVTCHMAPSGRDDLGQHAMRLRDGATELVEATCDRCHPGLTTFDRVVGRDYDGDGQMRGVQTEVTGLLEILFQAIRAADAQQGVSRPGGVGTPAQVDPAKTTAALRRAAYNYNFVITDGSLGVHNTTYAVQLLQRTYGQLTGTPFLTAFPRAFLR